MSWSVGSNVTAGSVLTASRYNQDVLENLNVIGGAWTSFTPSWTNVTTTSATNEGHYMAAGKFYVVRIKLTWGASTAFTGSPLLTLPNSASLRSIYGTTFPLGQVSMTDVSTGALFVGSVIPRDTGVTQVRFISYNAGGTYLQAGSWDATNPATWATGDRMEAQFMFEAA